MSEQSMCDYCHSKLPLSEKRVTVYRKRQGQVFVLENVPARVCQTCGERYFAAEVVQAMEKMMTEPAVPTRTMTVPVIAFAG
jgi:YgiT-type zinc finger domain-containing protein